MRSAMVPFVLILAFFPPSTGVYRSGAGGAAAPKFSDWGPPVVVPNVNSEFADFGPAISPDGRSLYVSSDRPGGIGGFDIWVSHRANGKGSWGTPFNLGPTINTNGVDVIPTFSRDGHWMFFHSDRAGGSGGLDLYMSYRKDRHNDFDWRTPVNLGPSINSSLGDAGASYFVARSHDNDHGDDDLDENGDDNQEGTPLLFFGSTRPPGGVSNFELYVSPQHPDGSFGLPTVLSELNSPCSDQRPSIRSDGLEIFFFSNRTVTGGAECANNTDLWVATRDTLSQVWYPPENLGSVVNSTSPDVQPYISSDSRSLYFASNRAGGPGLLDVYVTTRNKSKPKRDEEPDRWPWK